jgi:hypothetical protein
MKVYAALIIALASHLALNVGMAEPNKITKPAGTTDAVRQIAGFKAGGGRIITEIAPPGSTDAARQRAGRKRVSWPDASVGYVAPAGTTDAVRQQAGRKNSRERWLYTVLR